MLTCACWASVIACSVGVNAESNALLDEVVAGVEANLQMIQFGAADYEVDIERTIDPGDPKGPTREAFQSHIEFDGEMAIWRFKDIRCLRDGAYDVVFDAVMLKQDPVPPGSAFAATLYPMGTGKDHPASFHPRYVGHGIGGRDGTSTIVDVIKRGASDPKIKLTASEAGDEITIIEEVPPAKAEYTVNRSLGFGLVRMREWNSRMPGKAAIEQDAEYTRADNGAYIAATATSLRRHPFKGAYVDGTKRKLVSIRADLIERPSEDHFTLAAMGLPKGTHVTEKATGTHYLFGVDAVTDEEIDKAATEIQTTFARDRARNSGKASINGIVAALLLFGCVLGLAIYWRIHRR